jgi:hypothetical protein
VSRIVNTGDTGLDNLAAVLGTDPLPWFRDFSGAMYADNAFDPVSPVNYTQPSWNCRSTYSALDYTPGPSCSWAYELDPRDPANGVTDSFVLRVSPQPGPREPVILTSLPGWMKSWTTGGVFPPAAEQRTLHQIAHRVM